MSTGPMEMNILRHGSLSLLLVTPGGLLSATGCDGFCIGDCGPPPGETDGQQEDADGDGHDEGLDNTGADILPDLCSYPPFAGLENCQSVPYLAMPLRGTDTVPPTSPHTVTYREGAWERSTYNDDAWVKLERHLSFQGGISIPTRGRTHFSIMVATDECNEGWWTMTNEVTSPLDLPVLGSEVLTVGGKRVLKIDHLVPDPAALTTLVQVVWFVELCDPYLFLIDAGGGVMAASTRSNPGGNIVQGDPGGSFEAIIGMGAIAYGNAG